MTTAAPPSPAERSPKALFQYSTWAHAGHGADECPEVDEAAGTCQCSDGAHFHAWCRLPNPFQHEKIRERSLAAKARKMRQLRTPDTDGYEILEADLDALAVRGDEGKSDVVDALMQKDWWRDFLLAVREVRDEDDLGEAADEGAKLYATIEEDKARFARLEEIDGADQGDEYKELQAHLSAYSEAVQREVDALTNPKRETLMGTDINTLVDMLRRNRIENEAAREFDRHYAIHEWLTCTYLKPGESEPYFRDLAHLEDSAPEVLAQLQETFNDLERTAQEAQGE